MRRRFWAAKASANAYESTLGMFQTVERQAGVGGNHLSTASA